MKIAFMFSGQGSEYIGMCQDLYNHFDTVKNIFNQANNILGYDVSDILFFNQEKLKDTTYTQPVTFVMYVSIVELLRENNITSTHSFGLSLGEYGALYDSGVINLEQGLTLLKERGKLMKESCSKTTGSMSAILGLEASILQQCCDEVDGYVVIANFNTYGQLVISGEYEAVKEVMKLAEKNGAKRCIPLSVDGAFHSKLMEYASREFHKTLEEFTFQRPNKKVVANTTGNFLEKDVKQELVQQITSSVYFYQSIEKCIENHVDVFIEIGPKRTLSGFVKKVNRQVKTLNVEDLSSLKNTVSQLEVKQ
jgi:[acyl-carrier-protein] S-malonyltransferase